jgi:hypothetical protein
MFTRLLLLGASLALVAGCGSGKKRYDGGPAATDGSASMDGAPDAAPPDAPPAPCSDPALTRCNGVCVDTQSDPNNCGGCGVTCTGSQTCVAGKCQEDCRKGGSCAPGTFCDVNDGMCKQGCTTTADCGQNAECDLAQHLCVCVSGFHLCGTACVSNSSPDHCGSSCTPCPSVPNGVPDCNDGVCGIVCNAGFHLCSGACVSNSSPAHCGASCAPCPSVPNGTATCNGTACGIACNTGFHLCSGACVSNSSPASCGASCTPCPSVPNGTATCVNGVCGIACDSGFHLCSGACLSDSSPASCGSSCTPCPSVPNGTATCEGGVCGIICNSGYFPCGTTCVALGITTETISTAGQDASFNEIAVDSQDRPHVLYTYYNSSSSKGAVITYWDGSAWVNKPFFQYPEYSGFRLALDPGDNEHLVFTDVQTPVMGMTWTTLYHGWFVGSSWTKQTVIQYTQGSHYMTPVVAIDTSSGSHVAFRDSYLGTAKVYYSGPGTSIETASSSSATPSLAVSSTGQAYLALGSKDLRLATRGSSGWTSQTIEPGGYWTSYNPVLALDAQDTPHLGYGADNKSLKYTHWDGSGWPTEEVKAGLQSVYFAFALDPAGKPHFLLNEPGVGLRYYRRDKAGAWISFLVDANTGSTCPSSLAIDSKGAAHLTYMATGATINYAKIVWPSCP